VLGAPEKCTEGQYIRATLTVELDDAPHTVYSRQTPSVGGGAAGSNWHQDGYRSAETWETHDAGVGWNIAWIDDPRIYVRDVAGSHVVKAKMEFEALDFVAGGEAPIVRQEGEDGPDETAWLRFTACASWDDTAPAGTQVASTFRLIAVGQPDSAAPDISVRPPPPNDPNDFTPGRSRPRRGRRVDVGQLTWRSRSSDERQPRLGAENVL